MRNGRTYAMCIGHGFIEIDIIKSCFFVRTEWKEIVWVIILLLLSILSHWSDYFSIRNGFVWWRLHMCFFIYSRLNKCLHRYQRKWKKYVFGSRMEHLWQNLLEFCSLAIHKIVQIQRSEQLGYFVKCQNHLECHLLTRSMHHWWCGKNALPQICLACWITNEKQICMACRVFWL